MFVICLDEWHLTFGQWTALAKVLTLRELSCSFLSMYIYTRCSKISEPLKSLWCSSEILFWYEKKFASFTYYYFPLHLTLDLEKLSDMEKTDPWSRSGLVPKSNQMFLSASASQNFHSRTTFWVDVYKRPNYPHCKLEKWSIQKNQINSSLAFHKIWFTFFNNFLRHPVNNRQTDRQTPGKGRVLAESRDVNQSPMTWLGTG